MSRFWNFSAGPAVLPEEVLQQVQEELLDWHGTGCSVMEMSHRGKEFAEIIATAESDLRELLAIPNNYRVLFLQGGATQQFAQIPLNLLGHTASADYLLTGTWSKKAYLEATRISPGRVRVAGSTEPEGFVRFLDYAEMQLDPDAAYVHVCTNETIHGVECPDMARPVASSVPVIADMSSHILSRPVDVTHYGLIYAGAQKNIGPAGVTLVIVRDDLLDRTSSGLPSVLDYGLMAAENSLLNTPPTFAIYVAGLVFQWLKRRGGLAAIERVNAQKAALLYAAIDESEGFYFNPVRSADRSRMNVPFILRDTRLENAFLAAAAAAGLHALKGHKSVGGFRASIYNAMPLAGVEVLVDLLRDFQRRNG